MEKDDTDSCWSCFCLINKIDSSFNTIAGRDFCARHNCKIVDRRLSICSKDGKDILCEGPTFTEEALRIESRGW